MTSKNIYLALLIFICQFVFSQKSILGKIIVKDGSPQGVHVINLVNEKETISNDNGEFRIDANIDDLLVFSSKHLDYQRKIIEENDFKSGSVVIEMTAKVTHLDEVKIIKYPEMDGYQMGILSRPAKKYTPAQRRLKTAGEFKPNLMTGLGLLAGALPVDPIINAISGRTKMLKKNVVVERQESLLSILTELYDKDYYINYLKIEPDHIKGFQFYSVQDEKLASILRSKNRAIISFALVQLAFEYNNLQGASVLPSKKSD